jgi:hypothetical protein
VSVTSVLTGDCCEKRENERCLSGSDVGDEG